MKYALPLVCLLLVPACDTTVDNTGPDSAPVSPECMEATEHSDLAWIQDRVLTPSCASFSSCHMGAATSAAGLNLEDGNSEPNLVGRVATSQGIDGMGLIVVTPGDSDGSYLMVLIDHVSKGGRRDGPLPVAGTMPFNNPLMCVQKRDAIARWIDSL